jgi:hypothetical protein
MTSHVHTLDDRAQSMIDRTCCCWNMTPSDIHACQRACVWCGVATPRTNRRLCSSNSKHARAGANEGGLLLQPRFGHTCHQQRRSNALLQVRLRLCHGRSACCSVCPLWWRLSSSRCRFDDFCGVQTGRRSRLPRGPTKPGQHAVRCRSWPELHRGTCTTRPPDAACCGF